LGDHKSSQERKKEARPDESEGSTRLEDSFIRKLNLFYGFLPRFYLLTSQARGFKRWRRSFKRKFENAG
jgi:hypothetical protein